jgi:RND family efflux transporter MFP subunit
MNLVTLSRIALAACLLPPAVWAADSAEGRLDWMPPVELALSVSGVVAEVAVRPGDRVKQGDVLLKLDARPFEAAVKRAQARVAQVTPARAEAKREQERAQQLFDRTALSIVELDQAKNAAAEKEGQYLSSAAELTQARLDLEYSQLKAPFDLLVAERLAEPGQAVVNRTQATPLLRVLKQDSLRAVAVFPAASNATLGAAAQVKAGGQTFEARVIQAVPEGNGWRVTAQFAVPPGQSPKPGQPATLTLP